MWRWSNRVYFSPCPSPQLRMSFIVFSTEGRILMSLTEDRWVQISSKQPLILFFSVIQLKWMNVIPAGHRSHTVTIPLHFYHQEDIPDRYFLSLSVVLSVWTTSSSFGFWHIVDSLCALSFSSILVQPPLFHCFPHIFFYKRLISCLSAWHQNCYNLFICCTLLVFAANIGLVESIILLPCLAVSGFVCKCSLIIWQNTYFQLRRMINYVFSGNAFAKVWRSSGGFFQGETPSCTRASWGWADSACPAMSWYLLYLGAASRRNRTDSRPLNNCCFRAGRSSVVHCMPTSLLSQSSFSLFTGQWADILWKHWRCVLFLLA